MPGTAAGALGGSTATGASFLPIGIAIGLAGGMAGRRGPGRVWAIAGLTLVVLAVSSFVVLISSVDD
jgi:hypothetical protein